MIVSLLQNKFCYSGNIFVRREILSWCGGDSRNMKAMKSVSSLLCHSNDPLKAKMMSASQQVLILETCRAWFQIAMKSDVYVQDIVYVHRTKD